MRYHQPRPCTELSPHRREDWSLLLRTVSSPAACRQHAAPKLRQAGTPRIWARCRRGATAMRPAQSNSRNGASKMYVLSSLLSFLLLYHYFLIWTKHHNEPSHEAIDNKLTKPNLDQRRPPILNPQLPNSQAHNSHRRARACRAQRYGYYSICSLHPASITGRRIVSHPGRVRDPVRVP